MLIKDIKLNNFRNYSNSSINLHPTLNIIIGPNGVGKTNILESIIVASNTKSFRTNFDNELISKNKEFSKVEVNADTGIFKVVLSQTGKNLFINHVQVKRSSDYIGKLNAILFKPSDLELFKESPNERRRILDVELSKISKPYLLSLVTYKKLLKDKNKILKEIKIDENYLDLINEQMIPNIIEVINEREKFFNSINNWISDIYRSLSNTQADIKIIYKKCGEQKEIKQKLLASKEKDYYYHHASFGPHHEDYYFTFNGDELNSVASQGQKRMVFIAFKFSIINYIQKLTGQTPIILLDDVLSELDEDNQNRLINHLPEGAQILITGTDINGIRIKANYNLIKLKERKDG